MAPYGLARNPAGYSRGMMFALNGLDNCALGPLGESRGGARSWIDDISMHANSFEGFADLFGRVLARMSFACMSLKASKCLLLHQKLEVLGYFITPDGIMMQPAKLDYKAAPSSPAEIRTFLGAVQFYRRFIPRLSLLAAPMNALLKKPSPNDPKHRKGTAEHAEAYAAVDESFKAVCAYLKSDAVVSAPAATPTLLTF